MDSQPGAWVRRKRVGQRVSQSCNRCRAMKSRCDEKQPACSPCAMRNLDCVRDAERRRTPSSSKRYQSFEQRLKNVESILQNPSQNQTAKNDGPMEGAETPIIDYPISQAETEHTPQQVTEQPGPNLPMSPILGLQASESQQATSPDNSGGRLFIPMYPIWQVIPLIKVYLDEVNVTLPIFHGKTFLDLCYKNLSEDSDYEDPAWWACLNTVIAMAIQKRTIHSDFQTVSEISWSFFKNAFSVYQQLVSGHPTMLHVQAMLSMALFLGGTADTKTMMLLVPEASKMIQRLDLHSVQANNNPIEVEQKRRVFWIAYIFESVASGHFGLSSVSDRCPNAKLPAEMPSDGAGVFVTSDGGTANLFHLRVQVAVIETNAIRSLSQAYSSPQVLHDRGLELFSELAGLRERIPHEIRPNYSTRPSIGMDNLPVIMLHCAFYQCASVIQKVVTLYREPLEALRLDRPLDQFISLSTNAPRAILALLQTISTLPSFPDLWILLRFQLCAAVMLLKNILQNPAGSCATLDMRLITYLRHFIRKSQREGCDLGRFLEGCVMLEKAGRTAISGIPYPAGDGDGGVHAATRLGPRELLQLSSAFAESDAMHLVQGLMGNMRGTRHTASSILADSFGFSDSGRDCLASFAPPSLLPSTYKFVVAQ